MRPRPRTCGLLLALCVGASAWGAVDPGDPARAAAEAWLKLYDAGNYEASWTQSARYFKEHTTKDVLRTGSPRVQLYTGRVISRRIKSVELMDRLPLPELPPGKHAVITFDTLFERTGARVETVTLMLEPDGVWRVTAYSGL